MYEESFHCVIGKPSTHLATAWSGLQAISEIDVSKVVQMNSDEFKINGKKSKIWFISAGKIFFVSNGEQECIEHEKVVEKIKKDCLEIIPGLLEEVSRKYYDDNDVGFEEIKEKALQMAYSFWLKTTDVASEEIAMCLWSCNYNKFIEKHQAPDDALQFSELLKGKKGVSSNMAFVTMPLQLTQRLVNLTSMSTRMFNTSWFLEKNVQSI